MIVPLALLPLGLAFLGNVGTRFFATFGSIAVAAPCIGFWYGEMKGNTTEGRLGRGCLMTLAVFAGYVVWALLIVPLVLRFAGK